MKKVEFKPVVETKVETKAIFPRLKPVDEKVVMTKPVEKKKFETTLTQNDSKQSTKIEIPSIFGAASNKSLSE